MSQNSDISNWVFGLNFIIIERRVLESSIRIVDVVPCFELVISCWGDAEQVSCNLFMSHGKVLGGKAENGEPPNTSP